MVLLYSLISIDASYLFIYLFSLFIYTPEAVKFHDFSTTNSSF